MNSVVTHVKNNYYLQSILSGILLYLSFTTYLFFLVFVAWVPLLMLANAYFHQSISHLKFLFLSWMSFLIWNALTTWWISLASVGGAIMAIIANSILMCMVFDISISLQRRMSKRFSPWWIIPFWISFEYLHFHWDLMWPWLTLGNVFAFFPYIVQWYELTGTSGGTLWIWVINILLANSFIHNIYTIRYFRHIITLLVVPILLSISMYISRQKEWKNSHHSTLRILIVQPNVDPYNDKFYIDPLIQLQSAYTQIKNYLNDSLDVILFPETFITENIREGTSQDMLKYSTLKFLKDSIINKYPRIHIITGANTFKVYHHQKEMTHTARQSSEGVYYDVFNTSLCIYQDSVQIFHKTKLVPGVEKMPYPAVFKPLEKLAINLGGTTGSLGQQKKPSLFYLKGNIPLASIICYESVFSDFVSQFFKLGAQTLCIITNDGWWGNTPGYYQHLMFGRLRAIENRTYISRCANTGISAVINPLGEIEQQKDFWQPAVIQANIPLLSHHTIYSKIGDVISPICIILMCIRMVLLYIKKINYDIKRPNG